MALSVVCPLVAVRHYGHFEFFSPVSNGQRSFGLADRVVLCLGSLGQRVAERVRAGAYQRLAAAEAVGRAFALYPAGLCCKRGLAVYEGGTVVFLAKVGTLQGHFCLADRQVPLGCLYIKVCCYIISRCILNLVGSRYRDLAYGISYVLSGRR